MADPQRAKGGQDTYILTKDFVFADKLDGNVKLGKGTLLCLYKDHGSPSQKSCWCKVLDTEDVLKVEVKTLAQMKIVKDKFVGLLEAITNLEERLELFLDEEKLTKLSSLEVGSSVRVQTSSSSNEKVAGIVRFKGKSKPDCGILFGVELLTAGKGFTDGSFKGQKFFSCKENGGVFVPASRLEPAEETIATEWDNRLHNKECLQARTPSSSSVEPLEVGSRVYVDIAGDQLFGRVTFYGYLPEKEENGIYVGIHLDQPEGRWSGWFKDHQLSVISSPSFGMLLPAHKVHPVSKLPPINHQFDNESTQSAVVGRIDKNRENMMIKSKQQEFKDETLSDEPRRPTTFLSPVSRSLPDEGQPESVSCRAHRREGSGPNQCPTSPSAAGDTHRDVTEFSEENLELGFEVNSMVEVNDPPSFGVIRWIGEVPAHQEKIAGLELEEPLPSGCTDGVFCGVRYFHCPSNKAIFVKLKYCRPDSRFISLQTPANQIERCNSVAFKEYTSETVQEDTPPESGKDCGEKMIGWKRGIQGHCNSCYLDATLFCMFAFSSVLDTVLLRPPNKNDSDSYCETRDLLRTEIVNPLRKHGYVCATKVMALRKILEETGFPGSAGFTSEEKDPEEFLNKLFQVLKVEPLFQIRSAGQEPQGCAFYQIFMEKKPSVSVPTVQQLLESSFVSSNLKFTEAPSCLIIQMPRNGKSFKMFNTIVPTLILDITDLLEDVPRECCLCQGMASVECRECYEDPEIMPGGIKQFCSVCSIQIHKHSRRKAHKPQKVSVPTELRDQKEFTGILPRQTMELFAVLSIETSHYVAFSKYGPGETDWLFFDSMADREGGQNGFNIPRVEPCPEVSEYLKMSTEELRDADTRTIPTFARRLLSDAYMCMYHSPTLSLYK
ncbi:ubiquitin carboxyl-terminal hydrolase CYLD-like [Protopterus annectens]|uniref:ubiquitin carboxyl-terminal hydrolase CYLD-like n=1 Tax=Protopterus annectens TaxID=7888 RepID=UPI001CF99967|nr:ubiquitin carboxyl-terminal hydrolase CYLD-like [Protopterus annectens]